MTKLSKRSIEILELMNGEVCMGTYGLVELELVEFEKEIEMLKLENLALQSDKVDNMIQASEEASKLNLADVSEPFTENEIIQELNKKHRKTLHRHWHSFRERSYEFEIKDLVEFVNNIVNVR